MRQLYKRTVRKLANLKLAVGELAVIGALSAVGTVIKQGEPYAYYAEVGTVAAAGWAALPHSEKLQHGREAGPVAVGALV